MSACIVAWLSEPMMTGEQGGVLRAGIWVDDASDGSSVMYLLAR